MNIQAAVISATHSLTAEPVSARFMKNTINHNAIWIDFHLFAAGEMSALAIIKLTPQMRQEPQHGVNAVDVDVF